MGIFRKQTVRAPWTTVLLVLLLALSIAASSIGFAAWTGANKQFDEIDSQYTTIGIHAGLHAEKLWGNGLQRPKGDDSILFEDGTVYTGPTDAQSMAAQSPDYISGGENILLSAYIEGMTALTSGTMNILDYNYAHDSDCYQLAVFAFECTSVEQLDWDYWENYQVRGTILDNVCLMDAYDLPPEKDTLRIISSLYNEDGTVPFEVGKTYLVRGRYWDYPINDLGYEPIIDEDGTEKLVMKRGRYTEGGERRLWMEGDATLVENMATVGRANGVPNFIFDIRLSEETGKYYFVTPEFDCWPYFAEYTGSWQDYLSSDEGTVWREEIIPNFEMNHASAPVILTDNIGSLYLFNTGDASILEGRAFENTEYLNGDAVCLVSASYAKLNDLHIGDTISVDYHDTGFIQRECVIAGLNSRVSLTIEQLPLTEESRMDIQKDYTIVGIYTSPEWTAGVQNFHADTIFVPKASVPGMDSYSGDTLDMLNAITIRNGSIDEFEAHMADNGMAGVYLYFDQGYSEAAATVQTLIDNAMRLMIVGVAMFLLASMLFLLLFARRVSAVMRSMRLLGVPKRGVWLESLGMLVMQEIAAVLLGNGLAVILYDCITAQLLSGTPALDPATIALCAGVQLALLIAAGSIWMHRIAGENLMQRTSVPKLKPAASGA